MLVLTALLVPALVVVGALAFGVTALWTGHQDAQRAVDLGSLAAAASSPTVSTDFPIFGATQRCQEMRAPVDEGNWQDRARDVVNRQLGGGVSPVATGFETGATAPMVCVQQLWESELLAALDACVRDVAELAGCSDRLEEELHASLPALDTLDASVWSAVDEVHALMDPADKLVTAALATQLGDACASETDIGVLVPVWVCEHRVADLLAKVDHRTGALLDVLDAQLTQLVAPLVEAAQQGLLDATGRGIGFVNNRIPEVPFDLAGVAPAVVTPRVQVDLGDFEVQPAFSPMSFEISSSATARRVIKSALVLPSIGIPGVPVWSSLPPATQTFLENRLGPGAAGLLERAGTGSVVDPNVQTQRVRETADRVLNLFDRMETKVSTRVSDKLCAALPPTVACPVGNDIVDRDHLLGSFMEDVWDVTQPPPGTTPTIQEMLGHYADSGEVVAIITGLHPFRPRQLFGEAVWTAMHSGHFVPDVSSLMSELMLVPALDVVPALIHRDGEHFRIERVAATPGLYKARLVK